MPFLIESIHSIIHSVSAQRSNLCVYDACAGSAPCIVSYIRTPLLNGYYLHAHCIAVFCLLATLL